MSISVTYNHLKNPTVVHIGCHWINMKFFWISGLRSSFTKNEAIWKKKKATEPILSVGCFIAHNTHIGTDTVSHCRAHNTRFS